MTLKIQRTKCEHSMHLLDTNMIDQKWEITKGSRTIVFHKYFSENLEF
jgi:hypothetical protein